jgi:DNA primase
MGTALNARHVQHLRRFAPRVVLVFDADAGGQTGVDRALVLFASNEMDLSIATLPPGLDPCDLLVKHGADAFRQVLDGAIDVLSFKLNQVLPREGSLSVEERRRAVDAILGIISLAPPLTGEVGPALTKQMVRDERSRKAVDRAARTASVKWQLMVSMIARRLALTEETVWARLDELRKKRREAAPPSRPAPPAAPKTRAAPEERELLEVLLAEPALVSVAMARLHPDEIQHPDARRLLAGLYQLQSEGEPPTVDGLRVRLEAELVEGALKLQDIGRRHPEREAWLKRLLAHFEERRARPVKQELQNQLHAASDHQAALELLRQLQTKHATGAGGAHPDEPDTSSLTGVRS